VRTPSSITRAVATVTDYDNYNNGSCIRDFVHVHDLCLAHLLALQHLMSNGGGRVYNLGNSNGYSVKEVIETARKVTGKPISLIEAGRRAGIPRGAKRAGMAPPLPRSRHNHRPFVGMADQKGITPRSCSIP
jgi:nucleoside-diphosphate-sugar epimerase